LKNLESAEYNEFGLPSLAGRDAVNRAGEAQMELFGRGAVPAEESAVAGEIRNADVERLSPLDALIRLTAWKERLTKGKS
jgi:hypothetical protein